MAFIEAYTFYKKNILPHAGGWMDQSMKFIEAMQIIESEISNGK